MGWLARWDIARIRPGIGGSRRLGEKPDISPPGRIRWVSFAAALDGTTGNPVLPRVRYGTFSQFGRRIRFRTELPAERPRNCVRDHRPNKLWPERHRSRWPHRKGFSQVLFGSHASDTTLTRSNAPRVICEKTRRSFVDGRDLTEINACKVRDSHHCGVTSQPSIRAELSGSEP
jgi:hypothetical protein